MQSEATPLLLPFLEVVGPDGQIRRFAAGTKAGFVLARFNDVLSQTSSSRVVSIEAVKDGEEPVEFGLTAELVNYGDEWTLQTVLTETSLSSNDLVSSTSNAHCYTPQKVNSASNDRRAKQSSFTDLDATYLQGLEEISKDQEPCGSSPLRYFCGEVLRGSPTQNTGSIESDQKRQHVYNTMFHVPWRCELLIDVGFFVCLDSFFSLFTVMPMRILVFLWRCLVTQRKLQRPQKDELRDISCLLVLIFGVIVLQQVDISYIYHMIRSQSTIKLYVVYNVLEIFDKLLQSFGSDVLQVLFNSADSIAASSNDSLIFEYMRFILDQWIANFSFVVHSLIILSQSITISAAIRSQNNALLTLLISNNFAEIKSNVFKRLTKENLHKLAYLDTVERFHIVAHLFFVLAQNLLAADEPWVLNFAWNAGMVIICEILVDVIKHAFLAKFNEIKPAAYSKFLQVLCRQILDFQSSIEAYKTMDFVPLAPACVVIRVLIPLYETYLLRPLSWWRNLFIFLDILVIFSLLVFLKSLVGLGLRKYARWYFARYRRKHTHLHVD